MLGLVTTLNDAAPVELRELPEPQPQRNEALVAVHAFSLNRGELRSVRNNGEGWVPGQDVAGVVLKQAEDGSGPPAGARVVALTDEFGWAQRVAVPSHRMAVLPDNCQLRAGGDAAGGRADGAAHAASWRAAAGQARADHRRGRRRRHARGAACGAIRRARDGGGRTRANAPSACATSAHAEVVEGIEQAQGRFGLILESAGGASLAHAVKLVEPKGTVVVYGNSSAEPTTLAFADFRGAPNSRVQSFSYFYSEAEDRFAPDLALLVSLIADGSLKPQIGVERSWREFAPVAEQLRDRRVAGKAVFLVD